MKSFKLFPVLMLFFCAIAYGQPGSYDRKRELKNVTPGWHSVILPNDIFGKTASDFSDIRIFGITAGNDTVEVPYLVRSSEGEVIDKTVAFTFINTSLNEMGYYFTFEMSVLQAINRMEPEFGQRNFDWKIKLEGSHNQREWFTVVDNYRILSISNDLTDFRFTEITFPTSKYRFFRLLVESKEKPDLLSTKISQTETTVGVFIDYPVEKLHINENKKARQTEAEIYLHNPVLVSRIRINIKDTIDYYRPVTVQYLVDSVKTEKGWFYNYASLASGIVSSNGKNELTFTPIVAEKLKILILNRDNQPVTIESVEIKGYVYELTARFTEEGKYWLAYGNTRARKPQYDIEKFTDKIPRDITALETGDEQIVHRAATTDVKPLFENKAWLWGIMTVIILLLGWFTLKMMKKM